VPDVGEELGRVDQARTQLNRRINQLLEREADRLAQLRSRPALAHPEAMLTARADDVARLGGRALTAVRTQVGRHADQLRHLRAQVRALSPQKTLDRGYAVVQLEDRSIVRDPEQAPDGTPLKIRVAGGDFAAAATSN
jgi:exodeoxyribonuclease VII large subunit